MQSDHSLTRAGVQRRETTDPIAQVFADATHDLVAPINQVSSLIGLLLRKNAGAASDPASGEILDHINQAVSRMRTLADGLRTISRLLSEPMALRPVDTGALVSAILPNFAPAIDAGTAQVSCEQLPSVMADCSRLTWLFQELIENAIRSRGSKPAVIQIGAEARGDDWLFSVRDDGIGLDSKSAGQVFRIFRRLNPETAAGSGVGLTICRQIIAQHRGEIWIESEPGQGTTVFFTLPKVDTCTEQTLR